MIIPSSYIIVHQLWDLVPLCAKLTLQNTKKTKSIEIKLKSLYGLFWTIFGRTELRIGQSRAKNYEESDFDVQKSLAPPKSVENHEKSKTNPKKNHFLFVGVKKSKIANRLTRVFPKFRGDRS